MGKFDGMGLAVEAVKKMTIMDPRNPSMPLRAKDGTEAFIEGHSSDSTIAVKFRRNVTTSRINGGRRNKLTGERLEGESVELLAALTTGWLLVNLNGELIDVPHSEQSARDLFESNAMAWLKDQWDDFTSERSNFDPASLTT